MSEKLFTRQIETDKEADTCKDMHKVRPRDMHRKKTATYRHRGNNREKRIGMKDTQEHTEETETRRETTVRFSGKLCQRDMATTRDTTTTCRRRMCVSLYSRNLR